ncbi:uracil-DNA glycosylase family protein [Sinomicrobium pectinilyticum]|uniref:Uracil-DNA glycosylase family protein n=1 Tax=Sinomicrobium pectinilyticum TaxID=1084421 RepID=A0A3N0F4I0_SINP1|nr:uracil-DNA glycosylase family protein [Sinomicrobium pectinilyticum]RNL95068.1 uracil-DNA glycosylase family protein [Sinomicrobium pectinilyticum]
MDELLEDIKNCKACAQHLEFGPNPVLSAHPDSKIVVIGQAPGAVVHQSGIPWDDKSGDNLRQWMQVSRDTFYNPEQIALIPMGFCYPGKGKSGDLPPRKECAPLWHHTLWEQMKEVKLTLLIGTYAQQYYLQEQRKNTLTETVKNFEEYLPKYFVLPHPSPRNNIWRAKNPWFDKQVIPRLREELKRCGL